jgi:DNA-binding transcriptional MerR regulator
MTENGPKKEMSLAQLAGKAGCSARTVRFYISRGLLPPPRKAGRGATYGPEHEERIRRIRAMQDEGLTLAEIGVRLAGDGGEAGEPVPVPREARWVYEVAPDVAVHVSAEASPWRIRAIQRALGEFAARLRTFEEEKKTNQTTTNREDPSK